MIKKGNEPNFQTYLIYARVSPKGSAWTGQETSIPVQIKECKEYVLRRDPSAQFREISDEFKTGKNLHRAGMQRILADIGNGGDWDCLVVWSLDRLTRSLVDALPLLEQIRDTGKGLMSVRQSIDMFSAGGRLQLHMMICFAEYERSMLSERVGASMRNIAARTEKFPMEPFRLATVATRTSIIRWKSYRRTRKWCGWFSPGTWKGS